jgi:hypothetical protein
MYFQKSSFKPPTTTTGKEKLTAPPSVFQQGIREAKQEMLNTYFYSFGVDTNVKPECKELDEMTCGKYPSACQWTADKCHAKPLTQWSGWTVVHLVASVGFDGNFIDVERVDGAGSPVMWKPGMLVRWTGNDSAGKPGIAGDYRVVSVEMKGEIRRLFLDTTQPLNYYWNRPELQVVLIG